MMKQLLQIMTFFGFALAGAYGAGLGPSEWAWECVPSVVRTDGSEFKLTVEIGAADVQDVSVTITNGNFAGLGNGTFALLDDGAGPDTVAGDGVFSAGPWSLSSSYQLPNNYQGDIEGASGLDFVAFGEVELIKTDGTVSTFASQPVVGALDATIADVPVSQLSDTVRITPHLVNVRYVGRNTQRSLRGSGDARLITQTAYQQLPDVYDFLHLFSVDHVEAMPRFSSANFNDGLHWRSRVDASGIGLAETDIVPFIGSSGRLLGMTILDTGPRGLNSANFTRQLLHQWGYHGTLLGTAPHYSRYSSAGSLLGGFEWFTDFAGRLIRDCESGENGTSFASDMDLYLMGLLDISELPPQSIHPNVVLLRCGQEITDPFDTYTPQQIATDLGGPRVPGTNTAQRSFSMAFLAESCIRWLTPTELTFYDLLAAEVSAPEGAFTPFLSTSNWVSIGEFFGNDTSWSTQTRPILSVVEFSADTLTLQAANLTAGSDYTLEGSDELGSGSWTTLIGPTLTPANYADVFTVPSSGVRRFYRIAQ